MVILKFYFYVCLAYWSHLWVLMSPQIKLKDLNNQEMVKIKVVKQLYFLCCNLASVIWSRLGYEQSFNDNSFLCDLCWWWSSLGQINTTYMQFLWTLNCWEWMVGSQSESISSFILVLQRTYENKAFKVIYGKPVKK